MIRYSFKGYCCESVAIIAWRVTVEIIRLEPFHVGCTGKTIHSNCWFGCRDIGLLKSNDMNTT